MLPPKVKWIPSIGQSNRWDPLLTYLLAIGAVVLTRKKVFELGNKPRINYPTDEAGLKTLTITMNGTISVLTGWISLLGKFMVYTDTKELDEGDFAQFGWLIAGFFESVCQLNYKAGEIQLLSCPSGIHLESHFKGWTSILTEGYREQ